MTLKLLQNMSVKFLNKDIKIVNHISEVHFDADNVQLVLPQQYTKKQLEEMLDD